ncbi:hypothetical protein [Bacillus subtilis]|uniref:hypothetical protein n=1 Tax=Bacillus subtilis TaxID=1423 RepID=UPI00249AC11F|nr:hypothetical protein [Bacillus subtilis]CAI6329873.1 Alp7R [Bacillus subtilis]
MAKKAERIPNFNVRTGKMSPQMYDHVIERINGMPEKTWREYVFYLIEKDMAEKQRKEENKEKDLHVHDQLIALKEDMDKQFRELRKTINQKTFYGEPTAADEQSNKEFKVEEGLLVTDKITGTIDEEWDNDF